MKYFNFRSNIQLNPPVAQKTYVFPSKLLFQKVMFKMQLPHTKSLQANPTVLSGIVHRWKPKRRVEGIYCSSELAQRGEESGGDQPICGVTFMLRSVGNPFLIDENSMETRW